MLPPYCRFAISLLAVFATVRFVFCIRQQEDMIQLLLNGGDTSGILTLDDIHHLLWQMKFLFLYDSVTLYDIYRDVVIDKSQNIQIQGINGAFHLDDVFFPHFIATGIFDNGYRAVQLIQLQIVIDGKAHAGLNMI